MSSRQRSMRGSRLPLKRSIRPILEDLEIRLVWCRRERRRRAWITMCSVIRPGSIPAGDPLLNANGLYAYDNGFRRARPRVA